MTILNLTPGNKTAPTILASLRLVIAVAMTLPLRSVAAETPTLDFGRDVMPILSANCFSCHRADANKRKAKLRLDLREDAIADRDGYQVIMPGNPEESELMYMITAEDEEDRMPPAEKSSRLSEIQISILRQWIARGAEYEPHWAYVPAQRPTLPSVRKGKWVKSPIDHFVLSRMES